MATILERNEEAAEGLKKIMSACNSFSNNTLSEILFDGIRYEHRTIQQNFWRVMADVIKKYSEAPCDLRNESAVKMCQEIVKNNKEYLPYI